MNALSHAPKLAYRNAPPAPYKGMLCAHSTGNAKATSETDHFKASTGKPRPNFTRAEVEVLLQNVDMSILFHNGYIHEIEFSAYLFIYSMPFAVFV